MLKNLFRCFVHLFDLEFAKRNFSKMFDVFIQASGSRNNLRTAFGKGTHVHSDFGKLEKQLNSGICSSRLKVSLKISTKALR